MIGIIGAMQIEIDNLLKKIKKKEVVIISGIRYIKGNINNKKVVVAKCGIGKVFAALCTQTMILKFNPEIILNTGVAAGMREINIGNVVVADNVVQHDMDTSPLGDPIGKISGINLIHIPCNKSIVKKIDSILKNLEVKHKIGTIATGDQFIADSREIKKINEKFRAIAFDMESGAIGQVCFVNGIKYGIIRSISDNGSDNADQDFVKFSKKAANISALVVEKFIKDVN
ncbi:MAG TPA: 5'-methylthioadenosine/adenosylhomocysteine nucleosidase [Saprospiraceae bacterium]|mgnify:CR=1 FL=1|nr:5'-methylthioadenosine/adenosylhomocysteine nucleosidase [Saprospiraceae bacterium]